MELEKKGRKEESEDEEEEASLTLGSCTGFVWISVRAFIVMTSMVCLARNCPQSQRTLNSVLPPVDKVLNYHTDTKYVWKY